MNINNCNSLNEINILLKTRSLLEAHLPLYSIDSNLFLMTLDVLLITTSIHVQHIKDLLYN